MKNYIDGSIGNRTTLEIDSVEEMKSVKEVCEIVGITRKTLFYYDKVGLLKPSYRKGTQNHKMYSEHAVNKLLMIRLLRKLGFDIEEIKAYLKADQKRQEELRQSVLQKTIKEKERLELCIQQLQDLEGVTLPLLTKEEILQ
ncbi:MAG: MerR family transcriptional regulator, partial [Solobacterium sp.]|nr:MerR family transcriptional regulator [Solobacterium sp.]